MPTVRHVAAEYSSHCNDRGLKPATMKSYRYLIDRFLLSELGERMVTDLIAEDFEKLYQRMKDAGLDDTTIKKLHGTAKRLVEYARRRRWVGENVARDAELPRSGRAEDLPVPSSAEVATFLSHAARMNRVVYDYANLIVKTGLKPGEAGALRKDDLHDLVLKVSRSVDVCDCTTRITESVSPRSVLVS